MTGATMRVLILGGYGYFGGNLVRLLADEARVSLIVAGRSGTKARAFCASLPAQAELIPAEVDRDGNLAAAIKQLMPNVVIDASGPFQAYGRASDGATADPYRAARTVILAGVHYVDLADASAFVAGFGMLDAHAKLAGVFALSGASSFPVLTAAAVRHLAADLEHVETIEAGVAPSPYADVGLSVIRAIASYAGQTVEMLRDGRPTCGTGLVESRRYTIAPPGYLPLASRRFSLVDVPDLHILPSAWPGLREVWTGAAPVPASLHRLLSGLAWLVNRRLLPPLTPLAPFFLRVLRILRWGEHRGGMLVRVGGRTAEGKPVTRTWHLLAEGADGPLIPSMACAAIVHRMLAGEQPKPGARAAIRDLELADYERLFARRTIYGGVREAPLDAQAPVYARVLGAAWLQIPPEMRALHANAPKTARGTATVVRGRGLFARLVAALVRFPAAGEDIPVDVRFDIIRDARGQPAERWTRTFAGRSFSSEQSVGTGRFEHLIEERFGPLVFGLAAVLEGRRLRLIPRRWTAFGISMPRFLVPVGDTYECVEDGCFHFHVEISLPLVGLIVRYRGNLVPDPVPVGSR